MVRRGAGLGHLTKLLLVSGRRKVVAEQNGPSREQQDCNGKYAYDFHAALRVKTRCAPSEMSVAQTVTKVTIMVRLTSSGRSRDCAACQASWPIPGASLTTSIGNSTPIPILMETPTSAISCGRAVGAMCHASTRRGPAPLARAVSTCGSSELC